VTGGSGFIGSHVVDALRAAGHQPRLFDLRPSPHHGPTEVETHLGDVLDPGALLAALDGCDAVAHLAAAADVDRVAERPAEAEQLNARGTLNVLEAARAAGVGRVLYASTIWVYGACEDEGTVTEATPLGAPDHLYTATKLGGEMYCRSYASQYGLDCTILRFGIPYGPRARPAAVIPAFVRKALAGEALTIAGTGEQCRRFVYVEDLADGVVLALGPEAANRTYNLVGHEDVSIKRIALTVSDLVHRTPVVHTPARMGDFPGVEVSGELAERELGWRPRTPFAEGVARYIEWYRTTSHRATLPAPTPEPAVESSSSPRIEPALESSSSPRIEPALESSFSPGIEPALESNPTAATPPPMAAAIERSRASVRDPGRVRRALGERVAATGLFAGAVGLVGAYLVALHDVGGEAARTLVLAMSVLALSPALLRRRDGGRGPSAATLAWVLAVAGILALVLPDPRDVLGIAHSDAVQLLLGVAAAGLVLALAAGGGRRLLPGRPPEEQPQDLGR
jgi:UDP-glucose 4-epimerase